MTWLMVSSSMLPNAAMEASSSSVAPS